MTLDIKDFYLNTPMERYEYMRLRLADIPKDVIETLDRVSSKEHCSRAALIREVLQKYISDGQPKEDAEAFGIWKDEMVDGVEYQNHVRGEWGDG